MISNKMVRLALAALVVSGLAACSKNSGSSGSNNTPVQPAQSSEQQTQKPTDTKDGSSSFAGSFVGSYVVASRLNASGAIIDDATMAEIAAKFPELGREAAIPFAGNRISVSGSDLILMHDKDVLVHYSGNQIVTNADADKDDKAQKELVSSTLVEWRVNQSSSEQKGQDQDKDQKQAQAETVTTVSLHYRQCPAEEKTPPQTQKGDEKEKAPEQKQEQPQPSPAPEKGGKEEVSPCADVIITLAVTIEPVVCDQKDQKACETTPAKGEETPKQEQPKAPEQKQEQPKAPEQKQEQPKAPEQKQEQKQETKKS